MSKQRHIIGRTVLELDTKQLADVWSLQEDVSRLFQQQGLQEMAHLFDQLVPDEEVVRLDRLEVEIGSIDRRFLADEFIHKLLAALRETLGDRLTDRLLTGAANEKMTRDTSSSDWEVLLHFLRYGRLPWWCPARDWQDWLPRWSDVMQSNTKWRHELRKLLINEPATQQRLVEQLPEAFRHQLILQLQPTWINWHTLLNQARQLMQSLELDKASRRYLKQQAWLLLLGEIGADNAPTRPFPATWTRNWLTQLVQIWRQSAAFGEKAGELLSRGNSASSSYHIARQRLRTILAAFPHGEQSLWLTALDEALTSIADTTAQQNQEETFTPQSEQSREQEEEQYFIPNQQVSTPSPKTDGEMLLYFLQYGRFPGEQPFADWQDWLSRWSAVVQSDTAWQSNLRQLLTTNPEVRQRLVTQLPEDLRYQLLLQLQPGWTTWHNLLAQATGLMQALGISNNTCEQLLQQAWLLLLAEISSDNALERPLPATTWTRNWLTQLLQIWRVSAPEFNRLTETSYPVEQLELSQETHFDSPETTNQTISQYLRTIITALPIAEHAPWLTALDQVLTNTSNNRLVVSTNLRESPSQTDSNSPLSTVEETAGLYVIQAGLVLLHPFIRFYLEAVGLLDGELFRDESAQQTAIYLLYYLATKQTDAPEYELVLPKLLCGWPLNQPVVRGLDLPSAALEEGENLLQTAIAYWQTLKSTSPDGLREGFLQRQGKLTRSGDSNWKLQVEQQAIDILLGSLPWGLSMVKLPWMDELLIVEWN